MSHQIHDTYALFRKPGSKKLVIFFSGANTKPGRFTFWKQAQAIDHNIMLINNGRNEWYQNGVPGMGATPEEVAASIRAIAGDVGAAETYTIGASMGAYGATLFAPFLDARALAFGPETIISLPHSRCAMHLVDGVQIRFPKLSRIIASSRKPISVLAGEADPVDFLSAADLASNKKVAVKILRRVGHAVPRLLAARDRLVPLIRGFVENEPLPTMPEQATSHLIVGLPKAYYVAFRSLKDRDWQRAISNAVLCTKLSPTFEPAHLIAGQAYTGAGMHYEAHSHFAIAAALDPANYARGLDFAVSLWRMGHMKEAKALIRKITIQRPNYADAHFQEGLIYLKMGNLGKAKAAIGLAAGLAPNDKLIASYANHPDLYASTNP